eukprot:766850-Amphidinium_carterae.1
MPGGGCIGSMSSLEAGAVRCAPIIVLANHIPSTFELLIADVFDVRQNHLSDLTKVANCCIVLDTPSSLVIGESVTMHQEPIDCETCVLEYPWKQLLRYIVRLSKIVTVSQVKADCPHLCGVCLVRSIAPWDWCSYGADVLQGIVWPPL